MIFVSPATEEYENSGIIFTVSGLIHENRAFIELARINVMFFMDKRSVNENAAGI
jgi:hypothetical protein